MKTLTKIALLALLASPALIAGSLPLSDNEKSWLKSVELIITPDERKEFKKRCDTHLEREAFIDLFWAKRDPDLSDDRNPFREEYYARMDYIAANYREFKGRPPRTDRGYIYMLLGKPSKVEYRTDPLLVGFSYRNPFPQFPPELWVYEDLAFGTTRRRAVIQMVPKNSFGDYVALVDSQLDRLLRKVKYEFVLHPDLEEVPSPTMSMEDLQAGPDSSDKPGQVAAKTKSLPVPSAKSAAALTSVSFDARSGNPLELVATHAQFWNATGKALTLLRFGFPVKSLNLQGEKDISATVKISYALTDGQGKSIVSDSIRNQLMFPNRKALDRQDYYTSEIAKLIDPGVYRMQVQVETESDDVKSYISYPLTVEAFPENRPAMTPIAIMDPDVNPQQSTFTLGGSAYAPALPVDVRLGEPFHPMFELVQIPGPPEAEEVELILFKGETQIKSWSLYAEEIDQLGTGAVICHPSIATSKLSAGSYTLRAEVVLPSGDVLVRETPLTIVNGK